MSGDDRAYQVNMQPAPIDYVPQRVVSLVPSLTESLFDLDLGSRLVGISDYCTRPVERLQTLPRVGGGKTPDLARITALNPDLVLANYDDLGAEGLEVMQAAGLAVWVTGPRSVFETLNLLWNIMDVFDHAVMVPRVREIERAYDYTQAAAVAGTPVRVFAPVWRDPWMSFNADTYPHDLVRVCGGANVFAEREERFPKVTLDEIVEAQPEVILLPDEPYAFGAADEATLRQLPVPAVQTGRIHMVDGSLLMWHGTRTAYALRDLPGVLMGET